MRTPSSPDRAGALGAAWSLVAFGLGGPDEEGREELRDGDLARKAEEALGALEADGSRDVRDAGRRLLGSLAGATTGDLEAERARVFGHSVRGPCPAYEIEYGPEHFLGKSHRMGDIAGFYRAFGVQVAPDAHERLDHVAVEAEFLALLALKRDLAARRGEEERAETCRAAEARFLEEHLGRFLPSLARRVAEREPGGTLDLALALAVKVAAVHAEEAGTRLGSPDLELREIGTLEEETVVSCSPCAAPGAQEPGAGGGVEV